MRADGSLPSDGSNESMAAGVSPALSSLAPRLVERLACVRWFLCDVDGVLTDGSLFVGGVAELKRFNVRDGLGMRLLMRLGIKVGWISARYSEATTRRAQELQVDFLHQDERESGPGAKLAAIERLLGESGVGWAEVCYVGDDIVDLAVLKRTGLAVAVANSIPEVLAVAHYVTHVRGGEGAVREVIELILKAQNRWTQLIESYGA